MTRLWKLLERLLLREARGAAHYRDELFKHVSKQYGEHEAREMMGWMQRMSPQEFQQYVGLHFVDDTVDELTRSMIATGVASDPEKAGIGSSSPRAPGSIQVGGGPSSSKGTIGKEPIPSRPSGKTGPSPLHGPPATRVAPGEKPVHAVGTAGQHSKKDAEFMRPGITQGPKSSQGYLAQVHNPDEDPKFGLVAAQKAADRLYKADRKDQAIALARQTGVPSPEERLMFDDEGRPILDAGGNQRIAVWSPDRVLKFMDADRQDLEVDPEAGRATSMAGTRLPQRPGPDEKPFSRLDMIRMGLAKQAVGAATPKDKAGPGRPPSFDGEVWHPHGREGEKRTMRPDPVTGNWTFGKRQVNPKDTGQKLVGLLPGRSGKPYEWLLPSEYAAAKADMAGVSVRKPSGDRKAPWKAWQHPPRRGLHAGPTPASPPQRVIRPEPVAPKEPPDVDWDGDEDDEWAEDTDPDIDTTGGKGK